MQKVGPNYVGDHIRIVMLKRLASILICSKHFVDGAGPTAMYTDPIPAIQIGSSSVVKKARPPPHDCVTTTSTSESMTTFEHNYASSSTSSTCDVEFSVADGMDISFCDDDGETPSLADCCTQVSSTTFSDASTQAHPTMNDASTQADSECDNWKRWKLFVDNLTANNKNCKFWTGIQTLSLLNSCLSGYSLAHKRCHYGWEKRDIIRKPRNKVNQGETPFLV